MITSNPRRTIAKGSCICRLGFLAVCRQVPSGPRDSGFSSGPAQVGRAGRRTGGRAGPVGNLVCRGRAGMAGTSAAALFDFRFQPVAFEDAESIGAHARVALWRRRRGGAGLLALAAVWVISRRSALTIGATAAVIGGLLVSHHAYVYDAVLLLPACALVLRLPAPKA